VLCLPALVHLVLPAAATELLYFKLLAALGVQGGHVCPLLALTHSRTTISRMAPPYLRILVTTPDPTVRRFADSEAQVLDHGHGALGSSSTTILMLSPGMHISAGLPSAFINPRSCRSRPWCGSRTAAIAGEETECAARLVLDRTIPALKLRIGRNGPGLASTWPRVSAPWRLPRSRMPTLSPASPWSRIFLNILTPVQCSSAFREPVPRFQRVADLHYALLGCGPCRRCRGLDREHVLMASGRARPWALGLRDEVRPRLAGVP